MSTRLTDAVFFHEHLDTTRPGLEEIPALAAKGDYAACRKMLAAYVRTMLQPELYFSKPLAGQKNLADGVDYERAEKALKNIMSSCGFEWDFGEEGPIDWFANPTYNGYKEWTWQLSRHAEWRVLARAYRATGDEKYAACAAWTVMRSSFSIRKNREIAAPSLTKNLPMLFIYSPFREDIYNLI